MLFCTLVKLKEEMANEEKEECKQGEAPAALKETHGDLRKTGSFCLNLFQLQTRQLSFPALSLTTTKGGARCPDCPPEK